MPVYAQSILVCDFNGTEPALHTPWTLTIIPRLEHLLLRLAAWPGCIPATPGVNDALALYFNAIPLTIDEIITSIVEDENGLIDKGYELFVIP